MTEIIVKRGRYGEQEIVNQPFTMELSPRMGKKGMYVTVDGTPIGQKRKVRVLIDSENDVKLNDSTAVIRPVEAQAEPEVQAETDEQIMDRMREKFQVLDGMTMAAVEGHVRAMIVTGPPGVGKSFGIETTLESLDVMDKVTDTELHDETAKRGVEKVASASALGLYQLLWEYRAEGSLLVLDDSDSVLNDEAGINMLKAATDSGKKRKLTWRTESRVLEDRGIPDEFEFEGSIIFVTNLDFEKSRGKIGEHLKAIVSRCHYLDMGIHDSHEKFLRCKQIVRDGMLTSYKFDDVMIDRILTYIEVNQKSLRELSLRMVKKIADLARMDPDSWQTYADQTCLRGK